MNQLRFATAALVASLTVATLHALPVYVTPYTFTTLAGGAGAGPADGTGPAAQFNGPPGVAVDSSGNVYVADSGNHTIRKITSAGVVTTLAVMAGTPGSADGTGTAAQFMFPRGVAVDVAGNLYVTDVGNCTIRKITPAGVVTTLAGTVGTAGSDDGTGSAAQFGFPQRLTVDSAGNVFVADTANSTIRKITPGGVVTTLAGNPNMTGSTDGAASTALFNLPTDVAVDASGNLFVADRENQMIRKISSGGMVTTLAGAANAMGYVDGPGASARFREPTGVAVDGAGNLYVGDGDNNSIRKITSAGLVTTLAGAGVSNPGSADGAGVAARFNRPSGIAVDGAGNVIVADEFNHSIRKGLRVVPGDFNGDAQADIFWQNSTSGDRGMWLMNGTAFASWLDLGVVSTDWRVAATVDFNNDGKADLLWENTSTGERYFWLMNGTAFNSGLSLGVVPTDWRIAAAADFTRAGKPDILWENTVTGDRGFWIMNGTSFGTWVDIGIIPTALKVVGAADFNADGWTDIVWENTSNGKRVVWLMSGTTFISSVNLGIVSTDWHIAGVADYNGDGKPDILWENTTTGDRGFWLMNGTAFSSWVDIGVISTDWRIAP